MELRVEGRLSTYSLRKQDEQRNKQVGVGTKSQGLVTWGWSGADGKFQEKEGGEIKVADAASSSPK